MSCASYGVFYTFESEFCRFMNNTFLSVQMYTTMYLHLYENTLSGVINMKKTSQNNTARKKLASIISAALCAVLLICANTNSCFMIHQPQPPDELYRFNKIK